MEQQIYIPTLSHWEYGNEWSGERGQARFWITPADGQMTAEMWRGPYSREFAQVLCSESFPISEEGICAMSNWLLEQAEEINQGPGEG